VLPVAYVERDLVTENMSTRAVAPPITQREVREEWNAMMERVREVARVYEYSTEVDMHRPGYLILDATRSDIDQVESILFWNLLFIPRSRVDDGKTIEISGDWLKSWRRYTPWSVVAEDKPRYISEKRPEVRVYRYGLGEG
jgi:hypothetical protein